MSLAPLSRRGAVGVLLAASVAALLATSPAYTELTRSSAAGRTVDVPAGGSVRYALDIAPSGPQQGNLSYSVAVEAALTAPDAEARVTVLLEDAQAAGSLPLAQHEVPVDGAATVTLRGEFAPGHTPIVTVTSDAPIQAALAAEVTARWEVAPGTGEEGLGVSVALREAP